MTLRVRLEIVQHGDESRVREIGRLDINNLGCPEREDGQETCLYQVIEMTPKSGGEHKEHVYHFRPQGAWELVAKVIRVLAIGGP